METTKRVLIVDDDEEFLVAMRMQLRGVYGVLTAKSIAECLEVLEGQDVDLVLLDVGLGEENGLEGIKKIHDVHPLVGVAMLSGMSDVKTVVEAIRVGAIEYLTKPVDIDSITTVVEKAIAVRTSQERCEAMARSQVNGKNGNANIVYKGEKMNNVVEQANKIREHNVNVLIVGETGTGKEILARYVHEKAGNGKRPFVAVNCAAIPEGLLESELFGYEAGSFTGANRRRIGKFELADKGDIFLDEITTMKLDLQVKLLRVLQEKEFCRLGSNVPIKANFRVISASNQAVDLLVERGEFRIDLYHRLRVFQLTLPPLRERTEDIPLLVECFLKGMGGDRIKVITEGALARLMEYQWPGNVRELANVVQSLAIMTKGDVIDEMSFPSWVMTSSMRAGDNEIVSLPPSMDSASTLGEYLRQAERYYIEYMLKTNDGNKAKAAATLGIARTTLYMKLKEFQVAS